MPVPGGFPLFFGFASPASGSLDAGARSCGWRSCGGEARRLCARVGIHPQALAEWLVTSEPSSDGPEQGSRPLWPVALGARAGGPVFVASAGPPPLPGWPAPLCHSRHSRQASGGRCCPCQGPSGCSRQEVSQSGSVSAAGEVELSPRCLRESREEPGRRALEDGIRGRGAGPVHLPASSATWSTQTPVERMASHPWGTPVLNGGVDLESTPGRKLGREWLSASISKKTPGRRNLFF